MGDQSIFSIDVESHLKKAASHTFGSAFHYPVELVRAALRRGALRVDIQLNKNYLKIDDNGNGVKKKDIDTLITIMDPQKSIILKEEAIELLQTRDGLGLLAIFAAAPQEIRLESFSKEKKIQLLSRKNHVKISPLISHLDSPGTSIFIKRSQHYPTQEKKILEGFCRSVSREVWLNNRRISGQSVLPKQIASMKINSSEKNVSGELGIPPYGKNCHIRLLDYGIPWHHLTLPPQQGFIFNAAIECQNELNTNHIQVFCQYARKLYLWLGKKYPNADPRFQERIEELFFTYYRFTKDETLLQSFSPFRILTCNQYLNLQQVRERVKSGSLYAVPNHKNTHRYNVKGKTVLSLTREQADFLINRLSLPIQLFNSFSYNIKIFPMLWGGIKKIIKNIFMRMLPSPKKILPIGDLSKSEQLFLKKINEYFQKPDGRFSKQFYGVQAFFISSKSPFPMFLQYNDKKRVYIRRKHPLIRHALKEMEVDSYNLEIFLPLILSGI